MSHLCSSVVLSIGNEIQYIAVEILCICVISVINSYTIGIL